MQLLYPVSLTVAFSFAYLGLYFFFPYFFGQVARPLARRSSYSILAIGFVSLIVYVLAYTIPNIELGNRILHAFGGGFLAFVMCFFAVRDSGAQMTRFQFLILSLLVTTALGVGNEVIEMILQYTTGELFSSSSTDTWLDLLSNTVGAGIAASVIWYLVPPVGIEPTSRP